MEKTITTNDLILYLYNETPLTETVLIQQDIDSNPETEEEFESLKQARHMLDLLLERPSGRCLTGILEYGRKTSGRRCTGSEGWQACTE